MAYDERHPGPLAAGTRDESRLAGLYQEILQGVGEDVRREGLLRTPQRAAKSIAFLTQGYHEDLDAIINGAVFSSANSEMVIVRDIELYSLCEHHVLPFFGKAHVAYVPNGKVIGLSKTARLVDVFARRLQVQERLTSQVANAIQEAIQPQGVAVILEAQHLCMMMRGVEKQHSSTITSAMLGVFKTQQQTRNEFLSLVRGTRTGI